MTRQYVFKICEQLPKAVSHMTEQQIWVYYQVYIYKNPQLIVWVGWSTVCPQVQGQHNLLSSPLHSNWKCPLKSYLWREGSPGNAVCPINNLCIFKYDFSAIYYYILTYTHIHTLYIHTLCTCMTKSAMYAKSVRVPGSSLGSLFVNN